MRKRRPKQLVHGRSAVRGRRLRASRARVTDFPCKPVNLVQPWVEPLTWGGTAGGDGMSSQVWSQADLTSHKGVSYFCGQLPNIAYSKHRKIYDSFWPLTVVSNHRICSFTYFYLFPSPRYTLSLRKDRVCLVMTVSPIPSMGSGPRNICCKTNVCFDEMTKHATCWKTGVGGVGNVIYVPYLISVFLDLDVLSTQSERENGGNFMGNSSRRDHPLQPQLPGYFRWKYFKTWRTGLIAYFLHFTWFLQS